MHDPVAQYSGGGSADERFPEAVMLELDAITAYLERSIAGTSCVQQRE